MNEENFDKISKIISKHTKAKKEFISNETSSETIEGWDSLAHIRIIMELEKLTNIKNQTSDFGE